MDPHTMKRMKLAQLIDDIIKDAIYAGQSEALKTLGGFSEREGVTLSIMHRSISQKRAQIIGYFDEVTAIQNPVRYCPDGGVSQPNTWLGLGDVTMRAMDKDGKWHEVFIHPRDLILTQDAERGNFRKSKKDEPNG